MTRVEFDETFFDSFKGLCVLYNKRFEPKELRQQAEMYFSVLHHHGLNDVLIGMEKWTLGQNKMPKPSDWLSLLPRLEVADVRTMSVHEAIDYTYAERVAYQDEPCSCGLCHDTGVTHRYLRFVPDIDESTDRAIKVRHPKTGQLVDAGHWAHGHELQRWYDARDAAKDTIAQMTAARPRLVRIAGQNDLTGIGGDTLAALIPERTLDDAEIDR